MGGGEAEKRREGARLADGKIDKDTKKQKQI